MQVEWLITTKNIHVKWLVTSKKIQVLLLVTTTKMQVSWLVLSFALRWRCRYYVKTQKVTCRIVTFEESGFKVTSHSYHISIRL